MVVRTALLPLKSVGKSARFHWMWLRACSWSSKAVRSKFIEYFESQGHQNYPSSSVIPKKGDGTYFTNSGMNQFKPLFLGQCDPSSKLWGLKRAVNSQKCIRVGGKHNDLEDVGHDWTHHTFFEMLGSWSFGDYFKREACRMAYELLTHHLAVPEDRLYFTYFGGDQSMGLAADEECLDIWASLGIPRERILPFGARDNFWDMGVTGPCGPCTEIHYDHVGGGRYAGSEVNTGSPNVVEIWNLVFMQHNRHVDQSLSPLPSHHVDTGMGLERMVAVMNGMSDNYKTDLFMPLFDVVHQITKFKPYQGQLTNEDTAYRILADHSRMLTMAISDGLLPSNDNLGHKVRIILHKCIHLCRKHYRADPYVLLPAMIKGVVTSLGEAYPELLQDQGKVIDVISSAIGHYDKTMEHSTRSFNKMLARVKPTDSLSGEVISALERGHFGSAMSLETIVEIAEQHGMTLALEEYQQCTREDSKHTSPSHPVPAVSQSPINEFVDLLIEQGIPTTNDAYKYIFSTPNGTCDFSVMAAKTSPCSIQGMLGYNQGQTSRHLLEEGHKGEIVLDNTCFYAEAGGQEADRGFLHSQTGTFLVEDVQDHKGYVVHSGQVTQGHIAIGQDIVPEISVSCREGNMRNHTGTHLVNTALLDVLSTTQQEGSNINPHRFTFDFLALSKIDDVEAVQSKVKDIIRQGHSVTCTEMTLTEAKDNPEIGWNKNESTASSSFVSQKQEYPDHVRVVTIGSKVCNTGCVSQELCGGTHVVNTADLMDFCITGLSAKSQHVQRVTCVTGPQAVLAFQNGDVVKTMCSLLQELHTYIHGNTDSDAVIDMTHSLTSKVEKLKDSSLKMMADCTDVFDNTKEDIQKILPILDSLHGGIRPLQARPLETKECVSVMKFLVDTIHQCQHLELLPKTSRHTIHTCVQEMEHKVRALVNANKAADLKKILHKVEKDGYDVRPNFVSVDPDMNPRQVLKVLTKHKSIKPLILLQEGKPDWNIVLSLPCDSVKNTPEQDMTDILELLQTCGPVKGKMASKNVEQSVMKFSIRGSNLGDIQSCVHKWWEEKR